MEPTIDRLLQRITYRYELLLGVTLIGLLFWPMFAGLPGFVGAFAVMLVLLHARNLSQYKRGTEDETIMDRLFSTLPFRYELLLLIATVIWAVWWFAAGMTGCMLGLGIVALALTARSSSQLKRGTVTIGEA